MCLFRLHSALHWLDLHGWDATEFAGRSSAEWCGGHQWTCLIGVVILHIWWCSDVAKMRMALEKCDIYAKFCNERDPCWDIYFQCDLWQYVEHYTLQQAHITVTQLILQDVIHMSISELLLFCVTDWHRTACYAWFVAIDNVQYTASLDHF